MVSAITGELILTSSVGGILMILILFLSKYGGSDNIRIRDSENLGEVIDDLNRRLSIIEHKLDPIKPEHYDIVLRGHDELLGRIDSEVGYLLAYRGNEEVDGTLERTVDDMTRYPIKGPNIEKLRKLKLEDKL